MKIGIITYHKALNYGGLLQAVATRMLLQKLGYQVFYIDYWPDYHKNNYKIFSLYKLLNANGFKGKLVLVLDLLRYGTYKKKSIRKFNQFIDKYIAPYCKPTNEEYDAIIYGSDQIWRKQLILNDYNPVYFAKNSFKAKKHIAFSASMGILPKTELDAAKIKKLVDNFDAISVRERDLYDYLTTIGIHNIEQTLDPTLLITKDNWTNALNLVREKGQKYVLVYTLHDVFDINKIHKFAASNGCIVKTLYGSAKGPNTNTSIRIANPCDFLSLILNAEYVFASSFHGLAFSLIFHKEFYISLDENSGRVKSLLNLVELPDRFLNPFSDIPTKATLINYNMIEEKLDKYRDETMDYLNMSLINL